MPASTDVRPVNVMLYFLPVQTRMPLKFGRETLTRVTTARVKMTVALNNGDEETGWGETPLSVTWVWPSNLSYEIRNKALLEFCRQLAGAWAEFEETGDPIEIGHTFQQQALPGLLKKFNAELDCGEPMPWLAALTCCSAFDIALHDAYGRANGMPVYATYNAKYMNQDLSVYLEPESGTKVSFTGLYPEDYFRRPHPERLPAWHLVGGSDPLDESELTGDEPDDGYPVTLDEWISQDGLECLKIKLTGSNARQDYERLTKVGRIAAESGALWLSSDFNCTVTDPLYVTDILDRLMHEHPRIYGMLLYVEQPFPYDLEANRIDVRSVSARKPLFMDESAHDWRLVRLGRRLGWTGVALKTCKTQTGALLAMCWAKAHGMTLMVQDLTNPMLAQIPHCLLAVHSDTIMGVETNSMQFYPEASAPESAVHPGLYRREKGRVDLSTIKGPGFGYRIEEICRTLPEPENN